MVLIVRTRTEFLLTTRSAEEIRIRFNDLMLEDREEKVKVANLESDLAERAKNCAGILFPFF